MTVAGFVYEIERCRNRLALIGKPVPEDDLLCVLLSGLSEQISVLAQIIESDEDMSFKSAVARLITHECRVSQPSTARPAVVPPALDASARAYAASGDEQKKFVCCHCGKREHVKRNCFKWKNAHTGIHI